MPRSQHVSCVMAVQGCRPQIAQAIWYFLRQDYPSRDLVVVDDGGDANAGLIPCDPRIHHVHLDEPLSEGEKLNLACELSTGELIALWAVDAWYSPHRLTTQVTQLENTSAQVAMLGSLLHYQPLTGRIWRYQGSPGTTAGMPGAGLMYRRAFWDANRFATGTRTEVKEYIRRVPAELVDVAEAPDTAVVLLRGRSTSPVNPVDPRWRLGRFDELRQLLRQDLRFYTDRSEPSWPAPQRQSIEPITLAATFMVYDGYGSMAEYLALGMARSGAEMHVAPFRIDPAGLSSEFRDLVQRSRPNPAGIVLCHAWWGENLTRFGASRDLFVKTAWETSRLPADWPARLNEAAAVMVPSRFTARVFRESGVTCPVEVVHEGVDPETYPYLDRPERKSLTTLVVGVLAARKNFEQAVRAWKCAFAGDPGARLILKARFQLMNYVPDDPRVQLVDGEEPTRGIGHWYQQADILLALGNEGFGLPLIEGMASGLPVVALATEAQRDVCDEAPGMVLPVRPAGWEPVDHPLYGQCGVRGIPDVSDAARQLRWVDEYRSEARVLGRRASSWAHAHRNVWDMGPATLAVMERHARSPKALRRTYAMWAPSNTQDPEYGYYTRDLAGALAHVRLHEVPPTAWRSRTLHVQQAPGAIDDCALADQMQVSKHNGLAVVVTEHAVHNSAEAWEQPADALVALSESRLRHDCGDDGQASGSN